jgi:hypothetical protein
MGANSERNHWVLKYDLIILLQSTNPLKWVSVACAGKNAPSELDLNPTLIRS